VHPDSRAGIIGAVLNVDPLTTQVLAAAVDAATNQMASSDQTHPPEGLGTDIEAIRQEARAIFERAESKRGGLLTLAHRNSTPRVPAVERDEKSGLRRARDPSPGREHATSALTGYQ
jgi:hypothetical protein